MVGVTDGVSWIIVVGAMVGVTDGVIVGGAGINVHGWSGD